MSGDNHYGAQPIKLYSDEMTETKKIVLEHFEKKLFAESNSLSYFQQKHQDLKVLETAWEASGAE